MSLTQAICNMSDKMYNILPTVYILHVKCGNTNTTDSYKYLLSVYTYKKCHD